MILSEHVASFLMRFTVLLSQVEMPGSAPLYKEGFVLRKNIMEGPHKKGELGRSTMLWHIHLSTLYTCALFVAIRRP